MIYESEVNIEKDQGMLRQDRYSLRTAPQFLGPQIEDLLSALKTVKIECNSSASLLIIMQFLYL
jgi:phenylalanine ammonia-lyase